MPSKPHTEQVMVLTWSAVIPIHHHGIPLIQSWSHNDYIWLLSHTFPLGVEPKITQPRKVSVGNTLAIWLAGIEPTPPQRDNQGVQA